MKGISGASRRLVRLRSWRSSCYQGMRYSSSMPVRPVVAVDESHSRIDIEQFKDLAFTAGKPLLMRRGGGDLSPRRALPAIQKWFQVVSEDDTRSPRMTVTRYLESFSLHDLPYELMYPQRNPKHGEAVRQFIASLNANANNDIARPTMEDALADYLQSEIQSRDDATGEQRGHLMMPRNPRDGRAETQLELQQQRLLRFDAPLALLITALKHNLGALRTLSEDSQQESSNPLRQLYIAQAPLNELPKDLQRDLPTPHIVTKAGKGDIYDSSIWLGLEPTYTPLHRDPNPNLFCQLCSSKVVRLLSPTEGDDAFRQVQMTLGRTGGNSRMRGTEMMEGAEREVLYETIWGTGDILQPSTMIEEAHLEPGDALFIPKGWWHSVRSTFFDGRLNGSVNWWFR